MSDFLVIKALADKCNIPNELVGNGIVIQPKVTLRIGISKPNDRFIVTVNGKHRYSGDRTPDGLFYDMPEIVPELIS